MSPIELTVPMPPSITNASGASRHWRSVYQKKMEYWDQLDLRLAYKAIPKPPETPIMKAHIRSIMYLGGAMDDDNAMARHKPLLDWLKHKGYIADDRRKNLTWEGLPEQIVKRDGNYRITLVLTPVPE